MTAFVVLAHGSSLAAANDTIRELAERLHEACGFPVEAAFLEPVHPNLHEATALLVKRGATDIFVIPHFLAPGIHLTRDLPRIIGELSRIHSGVRIEATAPLDGHPALLEILIDRAREAVGRCGALKP